MFELYADRFTWLDLEKQENVHKFLEGWLPYYPIETHTSLTFLVHTKMWRQSPGNPISISEARSLCYLPRSSPHKDELTAISTWGKFLGSHLAFTLANADEANGTPTRKALLRKAYLLAELWGFTGQPIIGMQDFLEKNSLSHEDLISLFDLQAELLFETSRRTALGKVNSTRFQTLWLHRFLQLFNINRIHSFDFVLEKYTELGETAKRLVKDALSWGYSFDELMDFARQEKVDSEITKFIKLFNY